MFVELDGLTLHCELDGPEGSVPLVFVNSLGTDLRIWNGVTPGFTDRFRTVRYDKRGHGLSDAPAGLHGLAEHTRDLHLLLERFEVAPAVVVGVSVGGMIAMDLASRHPDAVRALVLCDTAARIGTPEFWRSRMDRVRRQGLPRVAGELVRNWFAPSFEDREPAAYRGYQNMLSRMPEEGYVGTCAALAEADLSEIVGDLTQPALVVFGADDCATPPEMGRELARILADSPFELIEDAGHLPCIEQPAALADRIDGFLQEHGYG